MTTHKDAATALNRISLDAHWSAEDAEVWCSQHRVTPSECIRLIHATAGRLSEMAKDAAARSTHADWTDANRMGGDPNQNRTEA